jgi:hypothetical protein
MNSVFCLSHPESQIAAFQHRFNFEKRKSTLDTLIHAQISSLGDHSFFHTHLGESKMALEEAKLSPILAQILKVVSVIIKFFNRNPSEIDDLLAVNSFAERLIENYTQILEPGRLEYHSFEEQGENNLYYLQLYQLMQAQKLLTDFQKSFSENHSCEVAHLPEWLQDSLIEMAATKDESSDLKVLFEKFGDTPSLIDQLLEVFSSQISHYNQLIQTIGEKERNALITSIQSNDKVIDLLANHRAVTEAQATYDTSIERVFETLPIYKWDDNGHDIEWIADPAKQVHAYRRQSSDGASIACVHNFTDQEQQFTVVIPKKQCLRIHPKEIFNSDALEFGGQGGKNPQITIVGSDEEIKYMVKLAPLSTAIIDEGLMEIGAEEEDPEIEDVGIVTKIGNFFKKPFSSLIN